jgi:hypothetical protein
MQLQNRTKTGSGISFNLTNPEGTIAAANANVHRVMPKIDTVAIHNPVGVLETGNVSMDLMIPVRLALPRKKKKSRKNAKRKNTHTTKGKSRGRK